MGFCSLHSFFGAPRTGAFAVLPKHAFGNLRIWAFGQTSRWSMGPICTSQTGWKYIPSGWVSEPWESCNCFRLYTLRVSLVLKGKGGKEALYCQRPFRWCFRRWIFPIDEWVLSLFLLSLPKNTHTRESRASKKNRLWGLPILGVCLWKESEMKREKWWNTPISLGETHDFLLKGTHFYETSVFVRLFHDDGYDSKWSSFLEG